MNSQQVSPQLQNLLKFLEKSGFRFFGYSEANEPLVIAPNGQVISANAAYNYVQAQMNSAGTTGGKGAEAMPQMPSMPQVSNIPDSQINKINEKKVETQKAVERVQQNSAQPVVPAKAPVVAATPARISLPFGDGFTPKSFNPTDENQVKTFTSQNSTKPLTDPKKWLSTLLTKFLLENKKNLVRS